MSGIKTFLKQLFCFHCYIEMYHLWLDLIRYNTWGIPTVVGEVKLTHIKCCKCKKEALYRSDRIMFN